MIHTRGSKRGILIVGDSLPSNQITLSKLDSVLDPKHTVYNSLIIPIKYYLNNYLNSQGYKLPLEKSNEDFFYYINTIEDPKTKSNPDLSKLKSEVESHEHKIILSMGNFAFWAVEKVLGRDIEQNSKIKELGSVFDSRLEDVEYPIHLPILHNIANLKFERAKDFIANDESNYISYFHYVGVRLGELLLKMKDEFEFIETLK